MDTTITKVYVPHGQTIHCNCNLPLYSEIKWFKLSKNGQYDYSKGSSLVIDISRSPINESIQLQLNNYTCVMNYTYKMWRIVINTSYEFYVQGL